MIVTGNQIVCYDAETNAWCTAAQPGEAMPAKIRRKYSPYVKALIPEGWTWANAEGFAGSFNDASTHDAQAIFNVIAKIQDGKGHYGQVTLTLWMMTLDTMQDVLTSL